MTGTKELKYLLMNALAIVNWDSSNENTMTLWLKTENLIELIRSHSSSVEVINLG